MTDVTAANTLAFVRKARFPGPPPRVLGRARELSDTPPLELKATEAQSLVVGSGLIAAAAGVPVQTREDLINCTLFAQLAASGEVASPARIAQWYEAYFRALTALGWSRSDMQFETYKFESKDAEAHKAVLEVLSTLMGPQATALLVVKAAIGALQSMKENDPWITLFDRKSKVGKSARFQVATAQVDSGGLLAIALCAFNLKAKSTVTQVLFFKHASSSTSLQYVSGKATISEAVLTGSRAAIEERLAAYRTAYIGQVKFP
jgi:hypothetical protein